MTAQIIAEPFGLPVTDLDDLTDLDFGRWQGLSMDEAERQDPELFRRWRDTPHLVTLPDGESLEHVQSRAMGAIEYVAARHPKDTVVMVSHEAICRLIVGGLLGMDLSRYWSIRQDLACINVLEVRDNHSMVTRINDICHLSDIHG